MTTFFSRLLCWLLLCASLFAANARPSITWGYDAQAQLSTAYDGGAISGFRYDSTSTPFVDEKENRRAGTSAVFARLPEFLAAKSADTIADGLRISPYRVTASGETFIRYESANPTFTRITPSGGVKPGTFAAPASDGLIPVADRVPVYNLPSPQIPRPNATTLTPPPGTPIIGPRPVVGGTGNEVIFPMGY